MGPFNQIQFDPFLKNYQLQIQLQLTSKMSHFPSSQYSQPSNVEWRSKEGFACHLARPYHFGSTSPSIATTDVGFIERVPGNPFKFEPDLYYFNVHNKQYFMNNFDPNDFIFNDAIIDRYYGCQTTSKSFDSPYSTGAKGSVPKPSNMSYTKYSSYDSYCSTSYRSNNQSNNINNDDQRDPLGILMSPPKISSKSSNHNKSVISKKADKIATDTNSNHDKKSKRKYTKWTDDMLNELMNKTKDTQYYTSKSEKIVADQIMPTLSFASEVNASNIKKKYV